MTTVQDIIQRGLAKSSAARPELMAGTELLDRVGQALQEAFQAISEEHPVVVATTAMITFNGVGFPRPADYLRGIKVTANAQTIATPVITPGKKIHIVPFDDQFIARGNPSVFDFGQVFYPVGQVMDPTGGALTLWYARSAIRPAVATENIDLLFPSTFNAFLEFDIAAYAAAKDKRGEDMANFEAQKGAQLGLMLEWAGQQAYEITQRNVLFTPPTPSAKSGRPQPTKDRPE